MTSFITKERSWRVLDGSRRRLFGQVGLRLIDELTGRGPVGRINSRLFVEDGSGGWRKTDIAPVTTSGGVLAFPALESHRAIVSGEPARRYRVQIDAEFYRPFYRRKFDGLEFDVFPYNDDKPPQTLDPLQPIEVKLAPATNYPFPSHVPVVRGVVKAAGEQVTDAEVFCSNVERVVTDERGTFSLPVRNKPNNTLFLVDAIDHRTNKSGNKQIKLPDALGKSLTIDIT